MDRLARSGPHPPNGTVVTDEIHHPSQLYGLSVLMGQNELTMLYIRCEICSCSVVRNMSKFAFPAKRNLSKFLFSVDAIEAEQRRHAEPTPPAP